MLTVAKVTQTNAGGYAEYLEGKARSAELGDYYLKDGERVGAPGRWAAGARAVGCDADASVTGEQLRELMAVRRPDTGGQLRRAGGSGESVAAIDATFSAPKSVSAIWALAHPGLREEIEQAHERAIDRALTYSLEQVRMIRQRVAADTVIHAKPAGLIATSWRHTTARAVADQPPDPQLHSHVLLHGAVRRDGRMVAIDSRSWLVHRRELGAAYRSELARKMNRLGFEIERGTGRAGRYFEIAGVRQELLDRWSSRHHQVQAAIRQRLADQERALQTLVRAGGPAGKDAAQRLELLHETGQLSPREERLMSTASRTPKQPATTRELDAEWKRAARSLGIATTILDELREPRPGLSTPPAGDVMNELTEFAAMFPARDARAVSLERSAGAPIEEALEVLRELRANGEIIVIGEGTGTTRGHRARERATVSAAEHLAAGRPGAIPARLVSDEIGRLDAMLRELGGSPSAEQRAAIELACGERQFTVIEGHAGTGKSTTLTVIARAHQADGREIIVTSTAALAAERLAAELDQAGVRSRAFSTAALHAGIQSGQLELSDRTTVIHDEAALSSTREQQQLLEAVRAAGARLIEVGDPRQNQPVGAGGLWPHLELAARSFGAHAELRINQRAHDPADRRDQALLRRGEPERAVRGYAARGRVHLAGDQRHAEDSALDAAQADRRAGLVTIVIAQTSNERLDALNARAQAIRQQHHELNDDAGFRVPGRPYSLYPGDHIQVRRTITVNDRRQLRNGTAATITAVQANGDGIAVRLGDGDELRLDREQTVAADVRLAYVEHPFLAQGRTTDTAHVIVSEHATREGSYVALTRARERTHLYATEDGGEQGMDRLAALAERIDRAEPELPSIGPPPHHERAIARPPGSITDHDAASHHHAQSRREREAEPESIVPSIVERGEQGGGRTAALPAAAMDEERALVCGTPVRRWPTPPAVERDDTRGADRDHDRSMKWEV